MRACENGAARCVDIHHLETGIKSNAGRNELVVDIRKTSLYAILLKEDLNLSSPKTETRSQTSQDPLQHVQIKMAVLHIKESDFGGNIIGDSGGQ